MGAVPLVYGSSKVKDIFPDDHAGIEIADFESPKHLAEYLHHLNRNDSEYEKHLKFKIKGGVKNKVLIDLMANRKWGINNDRKKGIFVKLSSIFFIC